MVGVLLIRGWTFFKGGLRCGLDATRFYQFSVLHIWLLKPQYFCSESSFPLNTVLCLVAQSCPILCNSMDCSPPGSSVRGILQARVLEWGAMPVSRGSSWPRDRPLVSCIAVRLFFTAEPQAVIISKNGCVELQVKMLSFMDRSRSQAFCPCGPNTQRRAWHVERTVYNEWNEQTACI